MILSCPHNKTGMGLCSECSEQVRAMDEMLTATVERRRQLREAISIAKKYGCVQAVQDLENALNKLT